MRVAYTIYFNQSQSLAQNTFAINFIDSTSYHRGQTVNVRATDYSANEAATLTVTNVKSGTAIFTAPLTASDDWSNQHKLGCFLQRRRRRLHHKNYATRHPKINT